MCTALSMKTHDFYFGRNLDYEFSYGESIAIAPRNYPFPFAHEGICSSHYAILGVAHVDEGYPLFYDAVNEMGLGMAGLNFVGNAVYSKPAKGKTNIAQYELISYVLSKCRNVEEAKAMLSNSVIVDTPFNEKFPPSQLHYLLADKDSCCVLESTSEGLRLYDNPTGVLTNNPPFPEQLSGLNRYKGLSNKDPENTFGGNLPLKTYSRGMGAIGLPGDLSSSSRFAKVAFVRANSVCPEGESPSVSQFFHILHSVEQQRGSALVGEGKYEITIYSSCYNAGRGICYYTTYGDHRINAVKMNEKNRNGDSLVVYPMRGEEEDIRFLNEGE